MTLRTIGAWLRQHFDIALLLAAVTEIPRWTVAFLAIHEPIWAGVPLGALLAYAASEGWKAYFADRRRRLLLVFNAASLLSAVFVITPVLYSMASGPIEQIDMTKVLPPRWLLAWSAVLALTTFAPLIQLAAVKAQGAQGVGSGQYAQGAQDARPPHAGQAVAGTANGGPAHEAFGAANGCLGDAQTAGAAHDPSPAAAALDGADSGAAQDGTGNAAFGAPHAAPHAANGALGAAVFTPDPANAQPQNGVMVHSGLHNGAGANGALGGDAAGNGAAVSGASHDGAVANGAAIHGTLLLQAAASRTAQAGYDEAVRRQALDLLSAGHSRMAVAKQLGVHRNTVTRWAAGEDGRNG